MKASSTIREYCSDLVKELNELPVNHRIAFAAWLAERVMPHFVEYCQRHNCTHLNFLLKVPELLWATAAGKEQAEAEINDCFSQIVADSPNMDDFPDYDALDASRIIGAAVRACSPKSTGMPAAEAAEIACEMAGANIECDISDPEREELIWENDRVQGEVKKQSAILEILKNKPHLGLDTLTALRKRANE